MIVGVGGRQPILREPTYSTTNYATGYYTTGDGWVIVQADPLLRFGGGMAISNVGALEWNAGVTADSGIHTHSITVGPYSGSTGGASSGTSGASSTANTGSKGSGNSHTNIPAAKKVRYVLRAL